MRKGKHALEYNIPDQLHNDMYLLEIMSGQKRQMKKVLFLQ